MNANIKYILTFAAGAAVGSFATYKMLKNKYEQIAKDEIEFQVERFSKNKTKLVKELEDANDVIDSYAKVEKAQVEEYKKTVAERGYTDYSNYSKENTQEEVKEEAESSKHEPYVITPEEFGEKDDYACIGFTYYADGVLTDDGDEPVEDVGKIVGDSLNHFGEYQDDCVHVRNDRLKCDYEILRDLRKYKDVISTKPHKVET